MSADNGIYILQFNSSEALFPHIFKVIHAQAIENITYFPEGSEEYKAEIVTYCDKSPTFYNVDAAHAMAENLQKEQRWTEYGICIMKFKHTYPTMSIEVAKRVLINYWKNQRKEYLDKYGFKN